MSCLTCPVSRSSIKSSLSYIIHPLPRSPMIANILSCSRHILSNTCCFRPLISTVIVVIDKSRGVV